MKINLYVVVAMMVLVTGCSVFADGKLAASLDPSEIRNGASTEVVVNYESYSSSEVKGSFKVTSTHPSVTIVQDDRVEILRKGESTGVKRIRLSATTDSKFEGYDIVVSFVSSEGKVLEQKILTLKVTK